MAQSAPAAIALARSPEYLMPPSAMTGTFSIPRGVGALQHRGELRHADTGNIARGADRTWADTGLDRIGAGIDQRLGGVRRGNVASDHLNRVAQTV